MRVLKSLTALTLAAGLLGAAASPDEPYPGHGPQPGPTCYGANYSYHVWNLVMPQEVVGIDSCKTAQMIAARAAASNYVNFVGLLARWYPNTAFTATAMGLIYAAQTGMLQTCAAPGRGVEFIMDTRNGVIQGCQPQ